jgi:hypothetical protein
VRKVLHKEKMNFFSRYIFCQGRVNVNCILWESVGVRELVRILRPAFFERKKIENM